jgi:hypothetical protein
VVGDVIDGWWATAMDLIRTLATVLRREDAAIRSLRTIGSLGSYGMAIKRSRTS